MNDNTPENGGTGMKLYGLKNCDTCRKALKVLNTLGNIVEFVDVRSDGISTPDLERFHAAFGAALLNTKSTTWRGLSDQERARAPLDLLADHPTLMKRPVIDRNGVLTLGWNKDVEARFS
jgi:arsenate reductase